MKDWYSKFVVVNVNIVVFNYFLLIEVMNGFDDFVFVLVNCVLRLYEEE